jgi:uncharacterized membrane protein YphA (DoxX/SURF4 family)
MIAWRRRIVALLRILSGCLCAFDACYRWLSLQDTSLLLHPVHMQMTWFTAWPWLSLVPVHLQLLTICVAAAETVIACSLICGAFTNLVCILAIFLTLPGCIGNTSTGALTMFFGPGYFDLGIMLVAILTFLGLSLGNAGLTYGADHSLVRKLGRWSFLASCSDDSFTSIQHSASDTFSLLPVPVPVPVLALTHTSTANTAAFFGGEPETLTAHSTHATLAPKERQRVLFM